jgi:hypothetical protein
MREAHALRATAIDGRESSVIAEAVEDVGEPLLREVAEWVFGLQATGIDVPRGLDRDLGARMAVFQEIQAP